MRYFFALLAILAFAFVARTQRQQLIASAQSYATRQHACVSTELTRHTVDVTIDRCRVMVSH